MATEARDGTEVVRLYFDALASKDLSRVPYAADAILWTPLGPNGLQEPIRGRSEILQFLGGVIPIIEYVEIQNLFASGDWVAGRARLTVLQPAGTVLRVVDAFHLAHGEIVEQENHFDPRPATG